MLRRLSSGRRAVLREVLGIGVPVLQRPPDAASVQISGDVLTGGQQAVFIALVFRRSGSRQKILASLPPLTPSRLSTSQAEISL